MPLSDTTLEFSVLGSGSSGNCALVRSASTIFLLDAGLSARQIIRRIEERGLDGDCLDGILVTHEHGDHMRGIDVFCRGRSIPVYCTSMTREVIRESVRAEVEWRIFESAGRFAIGDITVQSFPVPHDAVDPLGFTIQCGSASLGVLSDVGHITHLVRAHLSAANTLFIEANYDEQLLQNDTRRPWPTKQRIQSRHGHLSNGQAAELAAEVASPALARIILGHLSRDCNDPELARATVAARLKERGHDHVAVCCASQDEGTPWFPVSGAAAQAPEGGPLAHQGQLV